MDDVEAVHKEQIESLRELIGTHGIKRVCVEGLTPGEMPAFQELVEQSKAVEADIPRFQEMFTRAQQVVDSERAAAIREGLLGLIDEQRLLRLTAERRHEILDQLRAG